MKSRFNFVIGFIIGAVIFGSTAAVATGIAANRTTSKVLVNGTEVGVEAYNINGSNYFKLRDIGQAVDFAVIWDGAGNRILIDTSKGYTPGESLPAPTPTPEPGQTPAMTFDEMKAEIIRLTNEERVRAGVPELAVLPALMDCAQAKADDMYANRYYGHNSPVYGTAGEMIIAAVPGTRAFAENLAPWTRTPAEAYAGWAESALHLQNMLNPIHTHIGVGVIEGAGGGYWWVQQFVSI
jgi:uncharacterized protein YkwD